MDGGEKISTLTWNVSDLKINNVEHELFNRELGEASFLSERSRNAETGELTATVRPTGATLQELDGAAGRMVSTKGILWINVIVIIIGIIVWSIQRLKTERNV